MLMYHLLSAYNCAGLIAAVRSTNNCTVKEVVRKLALNVSDRLPGRIVCCMYISQISSNLHNGLPKRH